MEKIYELNNCRLLVFFEDKLIRIKRPKALQRFLSEDIDARSNILVEHIKLDYFKFIGKPLAISNESMVIEIWGHVYASHFAEAIKNLANLKLVENLADFILKRSNCVDCGENEVDSNRQFWDVLANFKGIILTFLPNKTKS